MNHHLVGLSNCLALFDWEGRVDFAQWLPLALGLFERCGVEADTCSIISSPDSRNRLITLRTLKKRLAAGTEYASVQLFKTVPDYRQLVFGWRVSAGIDEFDGPSATFAWDQELFAFDVGWILQVVKSMSSLCRLTYGIGYQRPFNRGPEVYALGMCAGLGHGPEDWDEGDRIACWMRERNGERRHLSGMLRDVYPLNFVGETHLRRRIDGTELRSWIEALPWRGQLLDIDGQVWCWQVPPASLLSVQHALKSAGLLIAWPPEPELKLFTRNS